MEGGNRSCDELWLTCQVAFMDALIRYHEENHCWPTNIVVFRDGVSDSQMGTTASYEMPQFTRTFAAIKEGVPSGASKEVCTEGKKKKQFSMQ